MDVITKIIELIFISALFINALLFVPQAIKIYQKKHSEDISLVTFIGFFLIQVSIILYGFIKQDYLLTFGYLLSAIACVTVIVLALFYRKKSITLSVEKIDFSSIIKQMPGHLYWKDKNGVLLGCNTENWRDFGLKSLSDFVGKTDYDLFPNDQADALREVDVKVIEEGHSLIVEEKVTKANGQERLYLSHKMPLKNQENQVIGILGYSLDITDTRKQEMDRLTLLENVIALTPGYVYWVDQEGFYLGCNDNYAKDMGFSTRKAIIGKQNKDLPKIANDQLFCEQLDNTSQQVIKTGEALLVEEPITFSDGTETLFLSSKAPLRNSNQEIIGMVDISIDISERKKAEEREKELANLQIEHHKNLIKEHERFVDIANQVAHDIRSPTAALLFIAKGCAEIPERDRLAMREAATSINDIANNLLVRYKKPEDIEVIEKDSDTQDILVSACLLELLTEKKFQYHDRSIKFDYDFSSGTHFAFIKVKLSAFRRAISNIVNNAVDALGEKLGNRVVLRLEANDTALNVIVEDNGKGMPPEIVEKIMANIAVTAGKKDGHGIGLTQVRETLQAYQGRMDIDSRLEEGTKIILTFPRIKAPSWIAEQIQLNADDLIIILDDDASIHGAWDLRFETILDEHPLMRLRHFKQASEALEFLNSISDIDKQKIFLLTDFELLQQEMNGLNVIEKSHINRSILVTSHYRNNNVLTHASKTNTKILPKLLAPEVPILINHDIKTDSQFERKKVDIIVLDDDKKYTWTLGQLFENRSVIEYHDPIEFLDNRHRYTQDVKIYIDTNYKDMDIKGLDIARILYSEDYKNLYLLTASPINLEKVPSYLKVFMKDDIDAIYDSSQK